MANQIIQLSDSSGNVLSPKINHLEQAGIYSVIHPNWDNSLTILNVAARFNGSILKVYGNAGTAGSEYPDGLPSALQNVTTVLMRYQMGGKVSDSGALHAVVILVEVYPTPCRIWVNTYNDTWRGWKSVTLT